MDTITQALLAVKSMNHHDSFNGAINLIIILGLPFVVFLTLVLSFYYVKKKLKI